MRFTPDFVIESDRLLIFAVSIAEYDKLSVERSDPTLWVDRGVHNSGRHLLDSPGPLVHRIP
ncbi:MAG: hypothetical protein NT174_08820, partial [Actinobacteria bacterium]|nr:hypothetical protein [Actinomycetota bacterium]